MQLTDGRQARRGEERAAARRDGGTSGSTRRPRLEGMAATSGTGEAAPDEVDSRALVVRRYEWPGWPVSI